MARGHAGALVPMIEATLDDAGLWFDGLDRLAVTVGPGGFTGVRIGLATVRGLAVATGLPVVGVTTLEAVAAAHPIPAGAGVLAVLDAKRADVYGQMFAAAAAPAPVPLTEPQALPPPALAAAARHHAGGRPIHLVGDKAAVLAPLLPDAILHPAGAGAEAGDHAGAGRPPEAPGQPDAATVARLAAGRPGRPGPEVAPLYLRPPDARLPAGTAAVRPSPATP